MKTRLPFLLSFALSIMLSFTFSHCKSSKRSKSHMMRCSEVQSKAEYYTVYGGRKGVSPIERLEIFIETSNLINGLSASWGDSTYTCKKRDNMFVVERKKEGSIAQEKLELLITYSNQEVCSHVAHVEKGVNIYLP